MAETTIPGCECGDGSGVVMLPVHAGGCTPLRCTSTCPEPFPVACPGCAAAALSEDLGTP